MPNGASAAGSTWNSKMDSKKKTIIVGVTGSIAAYKAAELVSKLSKLGYEVFVAMTHGGEEFVTPLTFRTLSKNPVMTSVFGDSGEWRPGHIDLADRADLLLIAPATANIIAELAVGLAGNPITEIALASQAPLLIAPAMNCRMWQHPATRENVEKLKARGAQFIGPEEGMLACGYEGIGRLWPVDGIVERAEEILREKAEKLKF